jgi:hypothetical protein
MGHKTLAITERYAHLSPAHKLAAVQRLNRPAGDEPTATTTATDEGRVSATEPSTTGQLTSTLREAIKHEEPRRIPEPFVVRSLSVAASPGTRRWAKPADMPARSS